MSALPTRREQRKQDNRQKLIDATVALIAEGGLAAVTVSRVVARAGVSRGLVNLHFETKEAMLAEVMVALSEEWAVSWRRILDDPRGGAAERLQRLLETNFLPPVFADDKMATWHCFYADPGYRRLYRERCHATDQAHLEALAGLVETLDREGGYGVGPGLLAARALRSVTGGLWLELLTEPEALGPEEARTACRLVLQRFFPKHFQTAEEQRRLSLVPRRG